MGDPTGDELTRLLREKGLSHVEDLVVSPRKGQHTLLVRRADGELMVLKHRSPSSGVPFREPDVYVGRETPHMPELLDSGPTHLLLAYHEGESLRRCLARGSLTEHVRGALVDMLIERRSTDGPARVADVRRALALSLIRLLSSGPRGVPVGSAWRHASRRVLARTVPVVLGPKLQSAATRSVELGPPVHQHGDLHLDNILVEEGRRVLVVDWEDSFVGTPICDWLYFWPQALRMPDGEEALRAFRSAAGRAWPGQLEVFDRLLPLFDWAARRNARFAAQGARHP